MNLCRDAASATSTLALLMILLARTCLKAHHNTLMARTRSIIPAVEEVGGVFADWGQVGGVEDGED